MRVDCVNKTNFKAGEITLKKLDLSDIASRYKELKEIAERDKLDLKIIKENNNKFFQETDTFLVNAKQETVNFPFYEHGAGIGLASKKAPKIQVADKIFETVVKAVENLGKNIAVKTGKDPKFLSWMK